MYTIRRAAPPDQGALVTMIEAFYEVDGHPFDRDHVVSALAPLLVDDRHGQVWLAVEPDEPRVTDEPGVSDGQRLTDHERVVGYAVVTWGWSLESGGLDCILDEIYVDRPGAGVGSTLLDRVKAAAADHGALVMALETEAPNEAARRFYRRHGFTDEDSTWMISPLERGSST